MRGSTVLAAETGYTMKPYTWTPPVNNMSRYPVLIVTGKVKVGN